MDPTATTHAVTDGAAPAPVEDGPAAPMTAAQLMEEHEKAEKAAAATAAAALASAVSTQKPAADTTQTQTQDHPAPKAKGPNPKLAAPPKAKKLDVTSGEEFPSLGPATVVKPVAAAPKWGKAMPAAVAAPAYTNGAAAKAGLKQTGQIRNEVASRLELQEHERVAKDQLRKPAAEIWKEVEKKTGVRLHIGNTGAGIWVIIIKGAPDAVAVARRELMKDLCPRVSLDITGVVCLENANLGVED